MEKLIRKTNYFEPIRTEILTILPEELFKMSLGTEVAAQSGRREGGRSTAAAICVPWRALP